MKGKKKGKAMPSGMPDGKHMMPAEHKRMGGGGKKCKKK